MLIVQFILIWILLVALAYISFDLKQTREMNRLLARELEKRKTADEWYMETLKLMTQLYDDQQKFHADVNASIQFANQMTEHMQNYVKATLEDILKDRETLGSTISQVSIKLKDIQDGIDSIRREQMDQYIRATTNEHNEEETK